MIKSNPTNCSVNILPSSFRDNDGYLFLLDGVLFRTVNESYRDNYELLFKSGLYDKLIEKRQLIPHKEVVIKKDVPGWLTIQPEMLTFISYPYEWCFSQLKDAALLTLDIQLLALEHGMCLKDASAYNIQFHQGRPVLIDTLSFDKYIEGSTWAAYQQFCRHFLAPLALMAKLDVHLNKLLIAHVDGIPLALTGKLLPLSSWFNIGLLMHLHIHSMIQKRYSSKTVSHDGDKPRETFISKKGLIGIVKSLRNVVGKLDWQPGGTEWCNYYNSTNYSDEGFDEKQKLVRQFLQIANPKKVWDLGANTGTFSRIAADLNIPTISFDVDPSAVEINYREIRNKEETNIYPLLLDLINPSPGLGWNCSERDSLFQRGPTDCIMALALIHHLAISNNLPFYKIADFLYYLCEYLIIEFVPKEDNQVQKMLNSRVDIFIEYDRMHFERVFSQYFKIHRAESIKHSNRILYLMQRNA